MNLTETPIEMCCRYTRHKHDKIMAEFQIPEIRRVPLEGLCLQIKLQRFDGGVAGFLAKAMEPPDNEAVEAAIENLQVGRPSIAAASAGCYAPRWDDARAPAHCPSPRHASSVPGDCVCTAELLRRSRGGTRAHTLQEALQVEMISARCSKFGISGQGACCTAHPRRLLPCEAPTARAPRSTVPHAADVDPDAASSGCNAQMLQAMDSKQELTALGHHLATLPVDARVGKMLLYAAILGCLDPVLTVAAALSTRSPFVAPLDKRDAADEAKRSFAGTHDARRTAHDA